MIPEPNATGEMAEMFKAITQYGENRRIEDGGFDEALAVKCVNGTFVGRRADGVIAYKGIPFVGEQPTGDLRWKAPVDVVPDDGVFEAYHNQKSPFQKSVFDEAGMLFWQGEDCLYLDVWRADDGVNDLKPVIVYVHGGGFEAGGTAAPPFDCANLVRENPDVVVATLAYRLGPLGYLHLSHLADGADYPDAQNLGLLDQLAGLKWVHENIAGFGGDPDNVTIWGESAGAGSVTLLPLVEGSHAYFHRVIAQSGSPSLCRSTEQAIQATDDLMAALGCTSVADLRKVDAATLAKAASEVLFIRCAPERDGIHLPKDTWEAYAAGAVKDIDFLQGCNLTEMDFFKNLLAETYVPWASGGMSRKLDAMTAKEREGVQAYLSSVEGDEPERYARLLDQSWFMGPAIRMAELQTKAGGRSFAYYYRARPEHGIELTVVFAHPEFDAPGETPDETFCKTMRRMWVQFAKTGDPSLSAEESPDGKAKEWPIFDLADEQVMVLDEFDIHPERESELRIVDRNRTYFLTKYYIY